MTENTPYLIAGLGNPGPKYRHNRHNVGFMVVNALAEHTQIPIRRVQFRALVGKGCFSGERLVLAKPQTYMNDSGQAVAPLAHFYKIPPEQMIVIHDDLDLPFGTLRLRPQGGAGGQHGVESIIAKLGQRDFSRLRVGIGRPPGRMDPRDYVLHDFDSHDITYFPELMGRAVDAILCFIQDGIEKAMNDFNGSLITEE